jgi:hypothetical protein
VFLPSGTYQISATVALPDGAVLIGEAWSLIVAMPGAAAFKSNASVAPMLQTASGGSVQLVNLMIGTLPGSGEIGAPPAKGDSPGVQLLDWRSGAKVRQTPSWPRSWANFSLLWLYSRRNAWANLHFLGQPNTFLAEGQQLRRALPRLRRRLRHAEARGRRGR